MTNIKIQKSIIPAYTGPKAVKNMSLNSMKEYWEDKGTFNTELYLYICNSRNK